MFLAATAVAVLLLCVVRLSERRGAFVSAVTHELRTPFTTFRLYTEMLAEGIVPTEEKRKSYLQTLRVEADRLGHLVENVLSYARLENGRSSLVKDEIELVELLGRLESPLRERDRAERHDLGVRDLPGDSPLCVRGDGAAIERIVINLVDNACKYATAADNRNIHLTCRGEGHQVLLEVRDHGQGLAKKSARRLFRPFSKSATEAAHSAPGVGLGLALCRRLAKSLGGQLDINHNVEDGASHHPPLADEPVKATFSDFWQAVPRQRPGDDSFRFKKVAVRSWLSALLSCRLCLSCAGRSSVLRVCSWPAWNCCRRSRRLRFYRWSACGRRCGHVPGRTQSCRWASFG